MISWLADLLFAHKVELYFTTDNDNMVSDRSVPLRNIRFSKIHPESRTDHGMTRSYAHGAPDIMLRFKLPVTPDILSDLDIKSCRDARGVIPEYVWTFKAISNDNTTKNLPVKAKLIEFFLDYDADATQKSNNIECGLRVTETD